MTSIFDSTFDVGGAPMLDEHFGVSVIVQRGGFQTEAISKLAFNLVQDDLLDSDEEIINVVERRVWYPKKTDLVFSGQTSTFEPRSGDILIVGTQKHQIAPHEGKPAVEEHTNETRWIIRTIRID